MVLNPGMDLGLTAIACTKFGLFYYGYEWDEEMYASGLAFFYRYLFKIMHPDQDYRTVKWLLKTWEHLNAPAPSAIPIPQLKKMKAAANLTKLFTPSFMVALQSGSQKEVPLFDSPPIAHLYEVYYLCYTYLILHY